MHMPRCVPRSLYQSDIIRVAGFLWSHLTATGDKLCMSMRGCDGYVAVSKGRGVVVFIAHEERTVGIASRPSLVCLGKLLILSVHQ
jgi:hypothetical protein